MYLFKNGVASAVGPLGRLKRATIDPIALRLGYKAARRGYSEFIPFKETQKAARDAGLSVSEYLERRHLTGSRSPLDQTMDGLVALGVFTGKIEGVCEIGPGSGRYLERTIAHGHPKSYEIYETSKEWRNWLVRQYGVVARKCDGVTLSETGPGTVDLVQAHKVFGGGLPFLNSVCYFREMARVVREGGWVIFDIMTESCFEEKYLDAWFAVNPWRWEWTPHMMARDYAEATFRKRGIQLVGSFQVPSYPGITECMVFRKASLNAETMKAGKGIEMRES